MPRASFLITVFNGAADIASAVASALAQDEHDIEVVVVLDGCTDATPDIVAEFADDDSRVRSIDLPRVGRGAALNIGARAANSPYLAILDADDVAMPWRVRTMIAAFESGGKGFGLIGSATMPFTGAVPQTVAEPDACEVIDVTRRLRRRSPFAHSSVMIAKEALDEVAGYDVKRTSIFDYDLYVRLAVAGFAIGRIECLTTCVRFGGESNFMSAGSRAYRMEALRVSRRARRDIPGQASDHVALVAHGMRVLLPPSAASLTKKSPLVARLAGSRPH